jgi:hypothetical protein
MSPICIEIGIAKDSGAAIDASQNWRCDIGLHRSMAVSFLVGFPRTVTESAAVSRPEVS